MAKNKDQNLDPDMLEVTADEGAPNADGSVDDSADQIQTDPEQDLIDIDQILTEEDPQFIQQINGIKIPEGANLTAIDQAIKAEIIEASFSHQAKKLFNVSKNSKAVITFWISILLVGAGIFYVWNSKKDLLKENLFLTSYAVWNSQVNSFNPISEAEPFYDNQRFSRNLMTLSKMFINVRASENSGPTPMLALEINVEGISSDAIIELKDREAEFKDMLLRFTEERTYDELATTLGKQNMCDQFRIIINSHLTQGQVRRVLLKSFIIKP
ncbi:MAG: flagellar basal body-associated FliL family protein [Bdellovibrionaceae bacterium]|nr:flagellar basal body-associated FliL family protein [Bdellovibrio sp.]